MGDKRYRDPGLRRVLVDVDGVLADFVKDILTAVGSDLTDKDIKTWDLFGELNEQQAEKALQVMADSEFWRNMTVLPHAKETIAQLRQHYDVRFLTSPWAKPDRGWLCHGWGYARFHWLKDNFGAEPSDLIISYDKTVVKGDILIDDKFEYVRDWQAFHPQGKAILMDRSYNQSFDWEERVKIGKNGWEFYTKHHIDRLCTSKTNLILR